MDKKRNWGAKGGILDNEDVEVIISLVLEDGYTMSEVAREFGVSRQYVQYIVDRQHPSGYHDALLEAKERRKERERYEFYVKRDWHCAVCNQLVQRFPKTTPSNPNHFHITCSPEHARAWPQIRYVMCGVCHDNHFKVMEATYRKKPEKYAREIAYIENPNRGTYERSVKRNSLTHLFLAKYRPDVLARLPFTDEIYRPQWNGVGPDGYDPSLRMHVQS